MRRLLIVSPAFPPTNAADLHRVRASLPHYSKFGWEPSVLAIRPEEMESPEQDPLLAETVPAGIEVRRVGALPRRHAQRFGLGSAGLRALPFLCRAGSRWVRELRPDLVYFSTTQFPVTIIGPYWQSRFGVPFVVDMQDPWVTGMRSVVPEQRSGWKHRLMRTLHGALEPRVMCRAGGLVSVSQGFVDALRDRYPALRRRPAKVVRFAVAEADFKVLETHPQPNRFFQPGDGHVHGVYVGRGGHNLARSLRLFFKAWRAGLAANPALFGKVRLHFVGTDYAPAGRGKRTVAPVAAEFGLEDRVQEEPDRQPYFTALQVMKAADFLVVPGSEEPEYAASKLCGCVLARRPLLATFHEQSNAVSLLRATRAGDVVTFGAAPDGAGQVVALQAAWHRLLERLPAAPDTNWPAFEAYSARSATREQCAVFDEVLGA